MAFTIRETELDQPIFEYLSARHAGSRQWSGFLDAMATELSDFLGASDWDAFTHRSGVRFAMERPLPACETLEDMQSAMSRVWAEHQWGWVALHEHPRFLAISHYCAPLDPGASREHGVLVAGFLQGVYHHWFQTLGSGSTLRVRRAEDTVSAGLIEYRLEP
jgi:hypothetical protein